MEIGFAREASRHRLLLLWVNLDQLHVGDCVVGDDSLRNKVKRTLTSALVAWSVRMCMLKCVVVQINPEVSFKTNLAVII